MEKSGKKVGEKSNRKKWERSPGGRKVKLSEKWEESERKLREK